MTSQTAEKLKVALESLPVRVGIVVGVLVSLGASWAVSADQRELTQCLAGYSDRANANQLARADLVAQDRQALDDWIKALDAGLKMPPGQSATAIREAITEYRLTRAATDGERMANPIPAPPSATCG